MHSLEPRIHAALLEHGVTFNVHDHADMASCRPVESPHEVAAHLGYELRRIARTVIVRRRGGDQSYFALVVGADEKIDFPRVTTHLGFGVKVAPLEDMETLTGFPRFGVSPIGIPAGVSVILCNCLLEQPTVLVGGGATGVEVELPPTALIEMTAATAAHIGHRLE
ncbi:aminoacyl-tRNA deacylase [Arthrobacter woluwensis]|uniref:aminoacyl-tRNA deacylase n=1 Tax=Arthrobacter woluwensis TaxID=156980 RepID=UPI001643A0CB|nr:YbaK/EbsC family protein [Arthrobacter woluwensis]